jgi:hypothetical protein
MTTWTLSSEKAKQPDPDSDGSLEEVESVLADAIERLLHGPHTHRLERARASTRRRVRRKPRVPGTKPVA